MITTTTDTNEAAEIARFIDTDKVIAHRGRTYGIYNPPADEHRADSPFILKSSKGRWYALTRNKVRPEHMFGIGLYGGGLKCLPGWFSDKSGELVSLG